MNSLFTRLAGWRGYALVAAICFAAGGLSAGKISGLYYGAQIASIEKTYSDKAAAQAWSALEETVRLSADLSAIDINGYQELARVQAENEKLRADVRAGALRLSVRTTSCVPGSASASGLGEDARAELDAKDGDDLLAITGEGDDAIIQLNTCIKAYDAVRAAALRVRGD